MKFSFTDECFGRYFTSIELIILSPFFAKEIFFLLIIVFKSIIFLDHFFIPIS